MAEEIKEILDLLNFNKDTILNRTCRVEDFMSREQIIKLLDYITNLQQENEKLKYNARGQVNDYFKDKYADEVLKKADLIKDFELTCYKNYELQQENERLKEELKNRPIVDFTFDVYKELENYKSRCEKAINYIEENYPTSTINYQDEKYKLMNILNGSDEK